MDWTSIKYIFQIPVSWYKKIHDRVFNAYGVNFIRVKEGDWYGGTEVGVDEDAFAEAVNQVVDLSGLSGTVKSVDDILPDANGNVELSGVLRTDVMYQQYVKGPVSFQQGVDLSTYGGMYGAEDYTRFMYTNWDGQGANGILLSGANQQLLEREPDRLYSTGADNQIATRGYCRLNFARASALCSYVKTVNNVAPDSNGNVSVDIPELPENIVNTVNGQTGDVTLGNIVNSVNNVAPVNGNVELDIPDADDIEAVVADYISEQDFVQQEDITSFVTENDVTSYVEDVLTSYATEQYVDTAVQDRAALSDLQDYARVVDGVSAAGGIVDFNLDSGKWVKTDSQGHLATTNSQPIELSTGNTGYLYANNGSLEFKQDAFVDLSTSQTVDGHKTWIDDATFVMGARFYEGVTVQNPSQPCQVFITGGQERASVHMRGGSSGSYISMNYNGGQDSFIMKNAAGLTIQDVSSVVLDAPANAARLTSHPTDTSTNSLAIATVGYCQDHFGGSGGGTVKSVDHVSPDANGNVQLNAIRTINGHNGDSVGNFAGVVTSINGNTPTDGAVTMTVVESVDGVAPVNGDVQLNAVRTVNNISPTNGNVDIDNVTSVDGHSPDSNGAISFGLAASKWVKTDSSGHLTTTNDNVVTIASNQTGQSYTLDFVTDVTWNGTALQKKMRRLVFSNGVLTSVQTETTSTIDTPVPYTTA